MQTNLLHFMDPRSIKTIKLLGIGVGRNVSPLISKRKNGCTDVGVLKIGFGLRHHVSAHLTGELNIQLCPKYL